MRKFVLLALASLAPSAVAQVEEGDTSRLPEPPAVDYGSKLQPELIGGLAALQERVEYPPEARASRVEGRVIVHLVVDEEGLVVDPAVARSPDPRLSAAALEAVRGVRFVPGHVRGRPVRVRFSLPVTFRLPDDGGSSRGPISWRADYSDGLEGLIDGQATMDARR